MLSSIEAFKTEASMFMPKDWKCMQKCVYEHFSESPLLSSEGQKGPQYLSPLKY